MVQLAIRFHPRPPVPAGELEQSLERQVDGLRAHVPRATVRLSRLTRLSHVTPGGPSADLNAGWFLELELPDGDPPLTRQRLVNAVRDMRLLGLEPTLLEPRGRHANGGR
jgi:hypothetical protein